MKSITRYLIAGLGGGAIILMGLVGTLLFLHVRSILVEDFDAGLQFRMRALRSMIKQEHGRLEFEFHGRFLTEFKRPYEPEYFQLWLTDGKVARKSTSLGSHSLPKIDTPLDIPAYTNLTLPDGRPGRAIGIRFSTRSASASKKSEEPMPEAPTPTLVVAISRTDLDHTLSVFQTSLVLAGLLCMAATALLVTLVVRLGLRALEQFADKAASLDAHSLHDRFTTDRIPAELQPLSRKFNGLLTRLEEAFRRERQFSADMAHELRTPITELRTLSELAIRWPEDIKASMFQDTLAIALRMETNVTGLLTLARCEEGTQTVIIEPIAVTDLITEILQPLTAVIRRNGITYTQTVPDNIILTADRSLLRLVLANLLANAAEYTPPGGNIQLAGTINHVGTFELTLTNTTDHIEDADVPHLFERMWRKDRSRTGTEHCGLGLTLSRAAASVMNMTLSAGIPAPHTLRLTLSGIVKT